MKLLIVESDLSIASAFCDTLSRWGHEVDHAITGQDALKRANDTDYDVMIVDTSLSDTRAADLILRLKKLALFSNIVVMTQRNTARLERSIRKLGVIYYMTQLHPTSDLRSVLDHIS